jgi:hypothetical protein
MRVAVKHLSTRALRRALSFRQARIDRLRERLQTETDERVIG